MMIYKLVMGRQEWQINDVACSNELEFLRESLEIDFRGAHLRLYMHYIYDVRVCLFVTRFAGESCDRQSLQQDQWQWEQ